MSILKIKNLSAFYGKARALNGVNIDVVEGGIIAVIGANGAGKSTLLDSVMRLTETTGDILLSGQNMNGYSSAQMVDAGVAYATERFNLFPYMSVFDNLMIGAYTARHDIDENLDLVYRLFGRLKERRTQETVTLSGGERQMVSLGRALMSNPSLLLVDEPTIGLAPKVCSDIAHALKKLNEETGLTIVITEQNVNFALNLAQKIYVLETGKIQIHGTAEELKSNPDLHKAYFGH